MAWTLALCIVAATALGHFARLTYLHRSKIDELRKQGLAMPDGWSWLTGHLLTLQKYVDRLPPDANVNLAVAELAREHSDTEIFLMDFWPVYPPLLMVCDPDAAVQVSTKYNLPKTSMHLHFMKPITGGPNLVSMSDQEWKTWRSLFNPGFSVAALTEGIPHIVKCAQVFQEKLKERTEAGIVILDDLTTRLTMDVILKMTLDANANYQRSENAIAAALGYITRWHSFWDPRVLMHPLRPLIQQYYGSVMNNLIREELEQRFTELKEEQLSSGNSLKHQSKSKSVVSLAIQSYISENKDRTDLIRQPKLENHFARYASYQIRLFLFAGNDTTSSTMVYVYHLLSQHSTWLRAIREEHETVFGSDTSKVAQALIEKPTLLNQCKSTMAVVKETLRLYPPAATMRAGRPGVSINDRNGNTYPMDYIGATILHPAVHRNPRVWPRPNKFLPDRFLVESGDDLYPYPPAFRSFEQGPRGCIGQTLVYNEILIALILTLRTFDIKPAYDEWDAQQAQRAGIIGRMKRRFLGDPIKTVNGDRAYQTDKAGTHPADGYPCRVSMSTWKESIKVKPSTT